MTMGSAGSEVRQGIVIIRHDGQGLWTIAPPSAPTVLDSNPEIDVAVLEVTGGHLSWSLLSGQLIPAAVIDDLTVAQDWIWAVYGEDVAIAIDEFDGTAMQLACRPALPDLAAAAWRLGYAMWAARWWPASTLDGIGGLDEGLLDQEIGSLVQECDLIIAGGDATVGESLAVVPARAADYALAAGEVHDAVMVLARGSGGWDWRRCPPGLVDASERAVSWTVIRSAGRTSVRVSVVAAPQAEPQVPAHLVPYAKVAVNRITSGEVPLNRTGDCWTGEVGVAPSSSAGVTVDVYVPGVGISGDPTDSADTEPIRQRIRDFAAGRLRRAMLDVGNGPDRPLLAEIAAAASDSDF